MTKKPDQPPQKLGFNTYTTGYATQDVSLNGTKIKPEDTHTPPILHMFESARKDKVIADLHDELLEKDTKIAEATTALKEAEHKSLTDHLTGLPNRFALDAYLQAEIPKSKRFEGNKKLCAIFIDVDGLKQINDCYGHIPGDNLLKTVSKFLKEHLRGDDTIYRIGGDEMMIVAVGDPRKIDEKMQKIQAELEEKTLRVNVCNNWKNIPLWGISYGVHACDPNLSAAENYDIADHAMYENKVSRKAGQKSIREERTAEMLADKTARENHEAALKQGLTPTP